MRPDIMPLRFLTVPSCCRRTAIAVAGVILCSIVASRAQSVADDIAQLTGQWELSNGEHDKTCLVTLQNDKVAGGLRVAFADTCAAALDFTGTVKAWTVDSKHMLKFLAADGSVPLELSEVESGMYEGQRPEGLYFLQKPVDPASIPPVEHIPDD